MKHNSYFDGKVQSLGINTEDGFATVGVILPGRYTFSTEKNEKMVIVAGSMKVKLPDNTLHEFKKDESFNVPAGKSFDIEATGEVAYICYYN